MKSLIIAVVILTLTGGALLGGKYVLASLETQMKAKFQPNQARQSQEMKDLLSKL